MIQLTIDDGIAFSRFKRQETIEDEIQGTNLTKSDRKRLTGGYLRVFKVMEDGIWRSPDCISSCSGVRVDSALRFLRLAKARGHIYNKKHINNGLYEYQILPTFPE